MPELFSRMDNLNWLTPSIADILDQGSTPPGGDGSIRERMLTIQRELEELESPARIVNVRSTPSYTLYIARPETVGRMGNRHTITPNEIKESIKQIAENHKDWLLGFIPQLREDDSSVGILLRTDEHRPMSLRRLLVRSTFRNHPSTLAFVLGITLEQQLIVDSIESAGHMLIVGDDNAKQHLIRSTLLSLIMLNTPAELRIAITGESSEAHKYLVGAPHALGRILTAPADGRRLIDGLTKEIQRRRQTLNDEGVTDISAYNKAVHENEKSALPRIVLIIDSLTDESWRSESAKLHNSLTDLVSNGAKVGIHLIVAVDDEDNLDLPSKIKKAFQLKVVTRASSKDISSNIPNFHASLLRFIDAFIFGKDTSKEQDVVPVELCAISNSEIKNVVEYWRQMSKKRYQDIQSTQTPQKTGITGVLSAPAKIETQAVATPAPPTPAKPSVSTLTRATKVLVTQLATAVDVKPDTQELKKPTITIPQKVTIEPTVTEEVQRVNSNIQEISASSDGSKIFNQAIALSAYLGWISRGALCDILYVSGDKANEIIEQLQAQQIVEKADRPTLRFIRPDQSHNGIYSYD